MPDPKNITEATTLADLREQRLLLGVISLRIYPSIESKNAVAAGAHHETGLYVGTGPTEATAIEAAFAKLRRALFPEPLKQYLQDIEDIEADTKKDTEDDQ
jgi:hypothetical protein